MTDQSESGATPRQLPVLVVGAGPVGLAAAADLLDKGVAVHCVDAAAGQYPFTRSLAAWPRMMEILRGLGVELRDPALGHPLGALHYFSGNRPILTLGLRAHTRPMVVGQPAIERLLLDGLHARGGAVRWRTRLVELERRPDAVRARFELADGGTEWAEYSYVIGADGASSTVRKLLGVPFEGSTYPVGFVLADVRLHGGLAPDQAYYYVSDKGMLALVGMPHGRYRVFTSAPPGLDRDNVTLDDVQRLLDDRGPGGLTMSDPLWLTAFAVHARHAERMRDGRVFLMGDAAHIHSPAGGQGLNTGIGDAHNLAWKLAMVWHGRAAADLLASYQPERMAAVAAVVRDADLQTKAWLVRKRWHRVVRDLAARVVSATRLADLDYVPRLAGLRVRYAAEPGAGGSRLSPYRPGALVPNWPVLVDGVRTPLRAALCRHRFTVLVDGPARGAQLRALLDRVARQWSDEVDMRALHGRVLRSGLSSVEGRTARGTRVVLVRPDQHVLAHAPAARAYDVLSRLESLLPQRDSVSPERE
ncbi:FAD-dependent monooxygenase [Actinokineospora sp. NBRC 105648]|uniref:FAD-dependent monooxygenase n=1 Tax=Actinokineospora sp. NBRC 105648 TaxID=3032206 RepID=UPI0024A45F78|nr:FAD-dependent monooxygenase [Actinokineospora sp. NBRC 105648]GLZ39220.1 oxygenase [Actinokineospora sp. NBRC 105648]